MSSYNLGPDNFEVFSDAEIVWMGEATWTHEVIYIPYATRDGQVGLVARSHSGDRAEFIYLNPSTETEDGVPNVFVFQGVSGDPANDQPVHHYDIAEPFAPVTAAKPRSPQEKFTAEMLRIANERRLDLVIERNYSNTGHFSFQARDSFEPVLRFPFSFQHGYSGFSEGGQTGPLGHSPKGGPWTYVEGGAHDVLISRVASVLDQRLENHEREWTVVGLWGDGQHDEGRFAESFTARTPQEAEDQARQWARRQGPDESDITIAGVLRGGVEVVS